ncbi:PTS glucose/sucrose transporter subunit IIB [uncultured Martelella sp.]|uniref:PTS glucose/sucrose transporter subunit IIB n=1 Tax=uncultured Martelella sp. TaxID=392331 RepID=UPI0029C9861E|nr:PTS glucose/sucrose transporter subunit IIB [uncultured Martelella sp.]
MNDTIGKSSREIVALIGGPANVESVTHCATRLRFNLKDDSKADRPALLDIDLVLSVVESAGQFQLVIGPQVPDVHDAVLAALSGMQEPAPAPEAPAPQTPPPARDAAAIGQPGFKKRTLALIRGFLKPGAEADRE